MFSSDDMLVGRKGKKTNTKLTEALGGSSLEKVIDGGTDDNPIATRVDGKSTNLDAMAARDVLDRRWLTHDLNKLLTSITVLVEGANVS